LDFIHINSDITMAKGKARGKKAPPAPPPKIPDEMPSESEDDMGDYVALSGGKKGKSKDSDDSDEEVFDLGIGLEDDDEEEDEDEDEDEDEEDGDSDSDDDEEDEEEVPAAKSKSKANGKKKVAAKPSSPSSSSGESSSGSGSGSDSEDYSDEDDVRRLVNQLDPSMKSKVLAGSDASESSDDDEDEEDENLRWGKKNQYYEADTADLEIGQEFKDAEDEEEAAQEAHSKSLARLSNEDFEDGFTTKASSDSGKGKARKRSSGGMGDLADLALGSEGQVRHLLYHYISTPNLLFKGKGECRSAMSTIRLLVSFQVYFITLPHKLGANTVLLK